jgi:hypothetical protein
LIEIDGIIFGEKNKHTKAGGVAIKKLLHGGLDFDFLSDF